MKEIYLNKGYKALVDDEDYERLNKFKWFIKSHSSSNTIYAQRNVFRNGKWTTQPMHKDIVHVTGFKHIDHIDGNGLNNQKINLRECSLSQNIMNSRKRKNTSSRYKGVSWVKQKQKWSAEIQYNKTKIRLGCFATENEAAEAYNSAALQYHKCFARINIVTEEIYVDAE